MTAIRHTATLTAWNGEQGIAQADSGEQYSVTRAQLYYAPYTVGSRIQIYVENGEVVDGGLIPIAGVDEDQQVRQQVIRGFNQSWIRLTVFMTFAVIVAGVVQTIVFWLFWNESHQNHDKQFAAVYWYQPNRATPPSNLHRKRHRRLWWHPLSRMARHQPHRNTPRPHFQAALSVGAQQKQPTRPAHQPIFAYA